VSEKVSRYDGGAVGEEDEKLASFLQLSGVAVEPSWKWIEFMRWLLLRALRKTPSASALSLPAISSSKSFPFIWEGMRMRRKLS